MKAEEIAGVRRACAEFLNHHARGTPQKRLFWFPMSGGRWRIDWQEANRSLSDY